MEEKVKKKYVEKQAPDKQKYVSKQPSNTNNRKDNKPKVEEPRNNRENEKRPKNNFQQKPRNESKRQPSEKPPKFIERVSSHSEDFGCVICSESVRKKDYIWTCSCCYVSLHLKCIKSWILNVNKDKNKNTILYQWSCPMCKFEYNETMPKYFCYCGKFQNPEYERDIEPHSCGQICGRKRGEFCVHPCPDLCHKGKCRPCQHEGSLVSCACGKTERMFKCSEDRQAFQCGKKCDRVLNCLKHKCERNCHYGECQPCKKKHLVDCYCKKNSDVVDCSQISYSCQEACGKMLDCEFHMCQEKCHPGSCKPCQMIPSLQKTCPCGKYTIQMLTGDEQFRKVCSDPIPTCGMPCKKMLSCGHECPRSCHQGSCPECKVIVVQNCRCSLMNRKIECFRANSNKEVFKCDNVCKRKRGCGQHNCNTECCEFRNSAMPEDHKCELTCQRILNCGKHTCGQNCHMGLCKKCPVTYSQPQFCPCGKTSLRPPVICGTHIPECDNICEKEMECGHKCPKPCHYGPCQCFEHVLVTCRCGRQKIETICGRQTLCLTKCKNLLNCGHQCLIQCHKGSCEQAHKYAPCRKACAKVRSDCGHTCSQLCHPERSCESFPCEAEIYIKCECGHRQTSILCGMTGKKSKKQIVCNKKCENLKRFDKLYKDKDIYYPNNMVHFALKNMAYVQNLEARLKKFILESENPLLEIEYKFPENYSKLILLNLFENHYHLNAHFYRYKKHSSFTLMQTDNTMVPRPSLSQYANKVSKGEINAKSIPFEYTVSFESEQKDKTDIVLRSLKPYLHKYYLERKEKNVFVHFWSKEEGMRAKVSLEIDNPTYTFSGVSNEPEDIEIIEATEIIEKELSPAELEQEVKALERINSNKDKVLEQSESKVFDSVEEKAAQSHENEAKFEGVQTEKLPILKTIPSPPKGSTVVQKSGPKIIIKKSNQIFNAREYPESKEQIQDIYHIDDDELYGEKIDWEATVQKLKDMNMGPEASEWRIRSLLMIDSVSHVVSEPVFHQLFDKLLKMYEKDKRKAIRILELQRLESKFVKDEMEKDGIYLSHHEPEMLSYAMLYNYFAIEKIEIDLNESQQSTPEVSQVQEVIECLDEGNFEEFFSVFKSAHYVLACALIPFVHAMRESTMDLFERHENIPTENLHQHLLFGSQAELLNYWAQCGLQVSTKQSKSKKKEVYYVQEGQKSAERIRHWGFLSEVVKPKRDRKYFLEEPEELVDEQWMTRSFFAFGDFKESVNNKYMQALVASLRN